MTPPHKFLDVNLGKLCYRGHRASSLDFGSSTRSSTPSSCTLHLQSQSEGVELLGHLRLRGAAQSVIPVVYHMLWKEK